MRAAAVLVLAMTASGLVSGCETTCTPTTTVASDARKLDLVAPKGSAVLIAKLTVDGQPLSGRTLTFDVQDDGSTVYTDDARTNDKGTGAYDLKRVDPQALVSVVRANGFLASFGGDSTYCASADTAEVKVVRAPAGLPVP